MPSLPERRTSEASGADAESSANAEADKLMGADGRATALPLRQEEGARSWHRTDVTALVGILVLAGALRLVSLATRGTWDADQGHDMLVLRALVHDGAVPLLGPPTSIGTFHHGALYYFLLAPAALLSGADPLAVTAEIALLGVAAVGLTWWLARSIGGPVAGAVAGVVMAVSATAINESTFIWNPNLIAFTSVVAVASAWRAWTTRSPRWWLVAALAQAVTMQCHVLGVVLLPPLVAWFFADGWRARPPARSAIIKTGLGAVVLIAATYLPLIAYEIGHDFAETRAVADFLLHGGQPVALDPIARLAFVGLRILAWPLAGLVTQAIVPTALAAVGAIVFVVLRLRRARGQERTAINWLAPTLLWSWLALGLGVSGLATVTPLPVDHYHAFLDPLVFLVVGLGVAGLWRAGSAGRLAAALVLVPLIAWNVATWPPAVTPDGGYPAAASAAGRIASAANGQPIALISLPTIKTPEAYTFPLIQQGQPLTTPDHAADLVVLCDALFVETCPQTSDQRAVTALGEAHLIDRFEAAPGRTISIYASRAAADAPIRLALP